MKIAISIPVFNRKAKLELLSQSLKNVESIENHSIYLFDDCSDEFDMPYLEERFPYANIVQNEMNLGADYNTYNICKYFLKTDCDYLFICDSDLIVHSKSIQFIEEHMNNIMGVLSLLNSSSHMEKGLISNLFIKKQYVGAAGTVFSKKIVHELIENIPYENANMWDWAFCNYLSSNGIDIYVSKNSYVLHTGIDGENSNVMLFEFSQNFIPSNEFETKQLNDLNKIFVESYITLSDSMKVKVVIRKILRENLRKFIGFLFGDKFLFKLLNKRKKRLRQRSALE